MARGDGGNRLDSRRLPTPRSSPGLAVSFAITLIRQRSGLRFPTRDKLLSRSISTRQLKQEAHPLGEFLNGSWRWGESNPRLKGLWERFYKFRIVCFDVKHRNESKALNVARFLVITGCLAHRRSRSMILHPVTTMEPRRGGWTLARFC